MTRILFTHGGGRFANQFLTELNLAALQIQKAGELDYLSVPFASYRFFDQPQIAVSLWFKTLKVVQIFIATCVKSDRLRYQLEKHLALILHRLATACKRSTSLACKTMYYPEVKAEHTDETHLARLLEKQDKPNLILCGWPLRCWDLVEKHASLLRQKYKFADRYIQPASHVIDTIRQVGYDKIIGVQIRQTDYKTFMNGQYFFTADIYLKFCEQVAQTFFPGKKVALLIASDTTQKDLSSALPVFLGPGKPLGAHSYICDIVALSLCDLIVAPPSTFSAVASFMGRIPYLPLRQADQDPNAQQVFQNGLFDAVKDPTLQGVIA